MLTISHCSNHDNTEISTTLSNIRADKRLLRTRVRVSVSSTIIGMHIACTKYILILLDDSARASYEKHAIRSQRAS